MKTILVTGGSGFIGTNFVKYVMTHYPQWNILNLDALTYAGNPENHRELSDDPRYTFVHGDILDAGLLKKLFDAHRFDGVFHFAAESHVDRSITGPEVFLNTNIMGTFKLLEASLSHFRKNKPADFRFLHVSTDEVYGSLGFEDPAFREDTPYDPSSPYSASKASSDHFAKAYFKTYGLPVVVTNCSNNYGPYQFPEKLIPLVILNILDKKPLPVYGKGENIRDWLYVADHCEALAKVFEKGTAGETYNIGGGEEKNNLEVVQTLCDLVDQKTGKNGTSRDLITFVADRPGHDIRYAINSDKTRDEIGFTARYSFEQALSDTIDWYLENLDWVRSIQTGEYRQWIEKQYGR
ncbi:MAG: dTDP-glucose 4,6-dehydratase [Proteobacteria bacterium]|nr:dTDP-glucose 4,6-dehydratase [Desulfobacula sp.]MBU3951927.1 dTDP-glucose 4,6-dehydratase [Pseudomonadota bacterium]MBU4132611.1 dTDP-glucose 4,6-dehydratase [Pseudomonadota bacterium]